MAMQRSARDYEQLALDELDEAAEFDGQNDGTNYALVRAQVYATLAQAAAVDDLMGEGLPITNITNLAGGGG